MPLKDVWIALLLSFAEVNGFTNPTFKVCCRVRCIYYLDLICCSSEKGIYAKLPMSTGESWYENGWGCGTSYASYISPQSPLHWKVWKNDTGCRSINGSLRERRRLKPFRPFLVILLFSLMWWILCPWWAIRFGECYHAYSESFNDFKFHLRTNETGSHFY